MFIITNDGQPISAISVDTTHAEDLQAALDLQELIFRISKTRLPIVDQRFVRVEWGKIHIAWDHFPATPRKHPFEIRMHESDPSSANPAKKIVIAGSGDGNISQAVSAFTKSAFGIPLDALKSKARFPQRGTIAIPEKMASIYGKYQVAR